MISITVFIKDNKYTGICSEGHAGYADTGEDIVCAAVSVLLINTLNSIEAFTADDFDGKQDDGYLDFHIADPISDAAQLLMQSLVLGLTDIQKTYGKTHIKIVTKEV